MLCGGDQTIKSVTGGAGTPAEDTPASISRDEAGEEQINPRLDLLGYAEVLGFRHEHLSTEGRSSWLLLKLFTNLGRLFAKGIDNTKLGKGELLNRVTTQQEMREILLDIADRYFRNDPCNLPYAHIFASAHFILRDGSSVSGVQIMYVVAALERPGTVAYKAFQELGVPQIMRIIREKYLFQWRETPEEIVRAVRYLEEYTFKGDGNQLFSEDFGSSEYSFPDGTSVTGKGLIELGRRMFSWAGVSDGEVLQRLHEKSLIVLESDEASIRRVLRYVVEKYFGNDPERLPGGTIFSSRRFDLPDGSNVSGGQIMNIVAALERPGMGAVKAYEELGAPQIKHIIREKYLFQWRETPEGIVRAVRYLEEYAFKGDGSQLFSGDFRSSEYSFPDGTSVTGEGLIELGRRMFSWGGVSGGEVLQRLHEKSLIVLESDEASIRRVLRYIVEQYFNNDPNNLPIGDTFLSKHFILPDGSSISGAQIMYAVAALERPGTVAYKAYQELGSSQIMRIIREKYLFQWGETPEGIVRAVRYLEEYTFKGDGNQLFSEDLRSREYSFPDGTSVTGKGLIELGRRMFSWGGVSDGEVLQRLHEKSLIVLESDEASIRRMLRYVVEKYFGNDPAMLPSGTIFSSRRFDLPDGSNVSGEQIMNIVAALERPGMPVTKTYKELGETQIMRIIREKYLFQWRETPEGIVRAVRYLEEYTFKGDGNQLFSEDFRSREYSFPDGTSVTGKGLIELGRRMFSWGGVSDGEVLQRLHEKSLIVLGSDEASIRRVLRYIVEKYFNNDAVNLPTPGIFISNHFTLPDGSNVSGGQIMYVVAALERPGVWAYKAFKELGQTQIMRIIREKYLFQWRETPEGIVRAVRYLEKYIIKGDINQLVSGDFRSSEYSFPDGTSVTGEGLIELGRRMFSWGGVSDGEVLQRLHEKSLIVLETDEASIRRVLRYIVEQHFNNDPNNLPTGDAFLPKQFILPDGSEVSGKQIAYIIAVLEQPGMSATKAFKELGQTQIMRIIREKYLFQWRETPEGIVRAVRYLEEYAFKGDGNQLFSEDFRSSEYSFPDGTSVTGEGLIELGRRMFSWGGVSGGEVLQRLHEKSLIVLETDEASIRRVLRYIVEQYFNNDPNNLPTGDTFLPKRFILPDGSEISGEQIMFVVAPLERPGTVAYKAFQELRVSQIMRIIREKYLFQWRETPEGIVRAVRYLEEYTFKGDGNQLFSEDFRSREYSFPDGTSVTGKGLIELGRRMFSWGGVSDGEVLQRLHEKSLIVLESDEASIRRMLRYVVEKYFGNDPARLPSGTIFSSRRFDLPDGSNVSGEQIMNIVAALERPGMLVTKASQELGKPQIMRFIREKYLGYVPPELGQILKLPGADLLADSPFDLLELVRVLLPDGERISAQEFVRGFEALNLREVAAARGVGGGIHPSAEFLEDLFTRRELIENLDAEKINRLCELYVNALYRDFGAAHGQILPYLNDALSRNADPLKEIFYRYAIDHFQAIENITLPNVKSHLYLHQRAAVNYLLEHNGAILADEPGMGKTLTVLAAAEKVDARRVLIVTPARGTSTWTEEIENHLENVPQYMVLTSDDKQKFLDPEANKEFFERLKSAKYLIVNYEALRESNGSSGANPLLTYLRDEAGLDTIILDESQSVDNPDESIQQARAVRQLTPHRRWLVSATPYQSRPAHLFTALCYIAPDRFTWNGDAGDGRISFEQFRNIYLKGNETSLKLLNGLLRQFMLRRRKDQVLGIVDASKPMEVQGGRLPRMNYVPPEQAGAFNISPELAHVMLQMISDFAGWAERYNDWAAAYNASLRDQRTIINLNTLNPLNKLNWIRRAMADPELIGLGSESPLYAALDRIVEQHIAQGKKLILFANHTRVIDKLLNRYAHLGVVRIDGTVSRSEQDEARHRFNNDPNIRIAVAHPRSGGVNINLPAGDTVILVEQPHTFVWRYQAEHRAHRADPNFVKKEVQVISMVGQYPAGFLEQIPEESRQYFEAGTVSEIENQIISRKRIEFQLVMDGYISRADFERDLQNNVATALGWSTEDLPVRIRNKPMLFPILDSLYEQWKNLPYERRKELEHLGERFLELDLGEGDVASAVASINGGLEADSEVVQSAFGLRNKFLRQNIVKRLFVELPGLYESGQNLTQYAKALKQIENLDERLIVPVLLFAKPWENEATWKIMQQMTADISEMRGVALEDAAEQMVHALAVLSDDPQVQEFIQGHEVILTAEGVPISDRIKVLSGLAMLKESDERLFGKIMKETFPSFAKMQSRLDEAATRPVIRVMGLDDAPETKSRLCELYEQWGSFEPLLSLYRGFAKNGFTQEAAQLKEVFGHVVTGDYREWRNAQSVKRTSGNRITYLEDQPDFWSKWSSEAHATIGEIHVGSMTLRRDLVKRIDHVMLDATKFDEMAKVEGQNAQEMWRKYLEGSTSDRETIAASLESRKREIGTMLTQGQMNGNSENIRKELHEINEVLDWIYIHREVGVLGQEDATTSIIALTKLLNRKLWHYTRSGETNTEIAVKLYHTIQELKNVRSQERTYKDVEISDTDDPNIIMRLGALRPDLINCFNYRGNPAQNHTIVDILGSRNKRVVIVKSGGEIFSIAVAKIRRTEDGRPVIFLERSLYRGGYDFQNEMLRHLETKAEGMEPQTVVAHQIEGRTQEGDITVHTTGSYSQNEYAEALFGVRPSEHVFHRARVSAAPTPAPSNPLARTRRGSADGAAYRMHRGALRVHDLHDRHPSAARSRRAGSRRPTRAALRRPAFAARPARRTVRGMVG